MTSSQEPPLTRREMRERERLLEQQTESTTPDAPQPAAAAPAPYTPPAPAPTQPPVAPAQPAVSRPVTASNFAPPPSAGGYSVPQGSPFGSAPAQPAQPQGAFPPRPVETPPVAPPAPVTSTTPERTLTRRELRAMLDGGALDEFDDELEASGAPAAPVAPVAPAAPRAPMPSAPAPAPAPAQVAPVASVPSMPAVQNRPIQQPSPASIDVSASPATGHWTSQLNAPADVPEPFDQLLSRGALSHGVPTTTNALILPSLPDQGALGNQITSAGEIIATGSIDLPRSYGATGVHPSQIDSSDVDRLFDQVEDVGTGVAPIAATRAISTQGAARAMIAPPKKEGMNVPLVLAVTAGVLALGVVATLVIGAVAGLF